MRAQYFIINENLDAIRKLCDPAVCAFFSDIDTYIKEEGYRGSTIAHVTEHCSYKQYRTYE
jgi:hypothetical protein